MPAPVDPRMEPEPDKVSNVELRLSSFDEMGQRIVEISIGPMVLGMTPEQVDELCAALQGHARRP